MYNFEDIKNANDSERIKIVDSITNRDYIKENIFVCLQKPSEEKDLVKEPYLNLEAYLRVKIGEDTTMKIYSNHPVKEETLFQWAMENSKKNIKTTSLPQMLGAEEDNYSPIVLTNTDFLWGASALLFPDVFGEICKERGWKGCIILPSSIYEVIVIDRENIDIGEVNKTIQNINETVVKPQDRLADSAYVYSLALNAIGVCDD